MLFQSRTKWVLLLTSFLALILLIAGYSTGTQQDTQKPNQVERDNDPDFIEARRQYLDWYLGVSSAALSPADHAKAMAEIRALPPSRLLQGREFTSSQSGAANETSSSWTFPVPPPIQGFPPWDHNACSAVIGTLAPHPTDNNIVYAAGPSGLTKSNDGGQTWQFVSDNFQSQTVSSISIDPNAPDHVFVSTGSSYSLYNVGIYRTTDAGTNWTQSGATQFAGTTITNIAVDPHGSGNLGTTTLYVAADRSNSASGLWRSTNGGETWSRLVTRPYNGIWGLSVDPLTNPSTLYIADSSGVWRGTDGVNWSLIYTANSNWNSGVRLSVVNSIPYLLSPSAGASSVYKLNYYSAAQGWIEIPTLFSNGTPIGPWKFAVDPSDPNGNIILIGTAEFYQTVNKGGSWVNVRPQNNFRDIHVDVQAIAFSPAANGLVYVGNDGGIWRSLSHGASNTWDDLNQNLPGALLYSIAISQDGSLIAGTQDNGTVLSDRGGIWRVLLGGDSNRNLIDPIDSNTSYYTSYWSDYFQRYNRSTGQSVNIRPTQFNGEPCNFFPAFNMNRSAPTHLVAACQHLVRSTDQGTTWTTIGGSLADPNQPNEWWNSVNTATEAPGNPSVIYAVAVGGHVLVTSDADQGPNAHWTNVTGNLGEVGGIFSIAIDPTNPQIAYLACGYGVYKTTTMGSGPTPWINLHAPGGNNFGYRDVLIDPASPNYIIAAGQMGVFSTVDEGLVWENLSAGIPSGMLVSGLSFDPFHRKLAASTYGRGAYTAILAPAPPAPTITPSPPPSPTPTPSPIPNLNVTVALPVATIDTSTLNFFTAVTATTIDFSNQFVGFQGDISFDSTVVSFQNIPVTAAGLTGNNWSVTGAVLPGSGPIRTLRLSGFSNDFTPLSGSGTLFQLNMTRVSSTPGASTALVWAAPPNNFFFFDSDLIGDHIPVTPAGSITIQAATANISGTTRYCSNPSLTAVPGVTLTLSGSTSGSTLSDSSGNYLFSGLTIGGNYTVTPSKTSLAPGSGGINTVDVIAVQRHFLNLGTPLSGCRLTAADVNSDSAVNTLDVIAIQRFALVFTTGIANTGKYYFSPATRSYAPLNSSQTGQNYDAFVSGDVAAGFVH